MISSISTTFQERMIIPKNFLCGLVPASFASFESSFEYQGLLQFKGGTRESQRDD